MPRCSLSYSKVVPPELDLFKGSANRVQNKINLFIFYAEVQPILFKGSASE